MKQNMITAVAIALVAVGTNFASGEESSPLDGEIRAQVDRHGKVLSKGLSKAGLKRVTSLRYTVILRNADGGETAIDEQKHTFKMGEEFRLVVEADTDLYLYVFHESADGLRSFLVPDRHDPAGYVPRLERGKPLYIPQDGYFEVTPPMGIERLMVFASPEKRPELTSTEAFTEPTQLSLEERKQLKEQQDRIFHTAMNIDPSQKQRQHRQITGSRIRLRGMSWLPKNRRNQTGRTVVAGSYDENQRPDLFLAIPLSSRDDTR